MFQQLNSPAFLYVLMQQKQFKTMNYDHAQILSDTYPGSKLRSATMWNEQRISSYKMMAIYTCQGRYQQHLYISMLHPRTIFKIVLFIFLKNLLTSHIGRIPSLNMW